MNEDLEQWEPANALKLIDDNVENTKELEFKPHPDFAVVRLLYGDIDADQCNITFSFRQDGQPHYISEPHSSPVMIQKVITIPWIEIVGKVIIISWSCPNLCDELLIPTQGGQLLPTLAYLSYRS